MPQTMNLPFAFVFMNFDKMFSHYEYYSINWPEKEDIISKDKAMVFCTKLWLASYIKKSCDLSMCSADNLVKLLQVPDQHNTTRNCESSIQRIW